MNAELCSHLISHEPCPACVLFLVLDNLAKRIYILKTDVTGPQKIANFLYSLDDHGTQLKQGW